MARDDLAWAAGFIDGEGCISIWKRKKNELVFYTLRLGCSNTVKKPLLELQRMFGGRISTKTAGRWKPLHVWEIDCEKAAEVLEMLLPYFRVKTTQAALGIAFQSRRLGQGRKLRGVERQRYYAKDENDFLKMRSLKAVV